LRNEFHTGFIYSDAWVQDARLVVLNAMDAMERGATIFTHTRCVTASRGTDGWTAQLQTAHGEVSTVSAKVLVNATGPWAVQFLDQVAKVGHDHALRLVKGSHIVVPRLFEHQHAYIFQQPDRRIVFAIPYEHDFTLIGTTDMDYHDDPSTPHINGEETSYLCEAANRYFKRSIAPADVVWSYSGVRPLVDDENGNASEVTRDYLLELDEQGAPLLNVFGGKLTTYRKLAEEAMDRLATLFPQASQAWTSKGHPLPGGERPDVDRLQHELQSSHPWLPAPLAWRLVHSYGSRTTRILGQARSVQDLGEHFGADLYQAEVDYLRTMEWAVDAADVLWRRSKLGLRFNAEQVARLTTYLADASPRRTSFA
jgi:glycerol-3-phosphate dehydrogenase